MTAKPLECASLLAPSGMSTTPSEAAKREHAPALQNYTADTFTAQTLYSGIFATWLDRISNNIVLLLSRSDPLFISIL